MYASILEAALSYASELLRQTTIAPLAKDIYRGVLRILMILQHDFPEFLAENHYRLCNTIPTSCSQLRNLVLSACPSSMPVLPDPFAVGLKVDRLEGIRDPPRISGDTSKPLLRRGLKEPIDRALKNSDLQDGVIAQIVGATYSLGSRRLTETGVDVPFLHSLVLYVGSNALSSALQKGGPAFVEDSPHATLMVKLSKQLEPEARYYFFGAIADQLRYPNSHTQFFSHALLHIFATDLSGQQITSEQIVRVLLERLVLHRPHPWGLIITFLEMVKNPANNFWEQPFFTATPQVCHALCHLSLKANNLP